MDQAGSMVRRSSDVVRTFALRRVDFQRHEDEQKI
jgi:hypothetical protein